MNLGETIHRLRSMQGLSQDELAERLNVSRQSVSKWENNNATPDLDKLMKLSEVFGVSLDELVRGEEARAPLSPETVRETEKSTWSNQKIIGIVLLCFALVYPLMGMMEAGFAGLLSCFVMALPFLGCGVICLKAQANAGLYCLLCLYMYLWLPAGVLCQNYIRADFAKLLQALHICFGGGLALWGWVKHKKGTFLKTPLRVLLYFALLAITMLISCLFLCFPKLLPSYGLLRY